MENESATIISPKPVKHLTAYRLKRIFSTRDISSNETSTICDFDNYKVNKQQYPRRLFESRMNLNSKSMCIFEFGYEQEKQLEDDIVNNELLLIINNNYISPNYKNETTFYNSISSKETQHSSVYFRRNSFALRRPKNPFYKYFDIDQKIYPNFPIFSNDPDTEVIKSKSTDFSKYKRTNINLEDRSI